MTSKPEYHNVSFTTQKDIRYAAFGHYPNTLESNLIVSNDVTEMKDTHKKDKIVFI